jgi:hypothetical protein
MLQFGFKTVISVSKRAKIFLAFYRSATVICVLNYFVDNFTKLTVSMGGARLRHYAASLQVAGTIPDEVNRSFN